MGEFIMVKRYIATLTDSQTLTNKTIDVESNTVSNIGVSNLKAQATSEAGKSFVVKSDGTWEIAKVQSTPDDVTIAVNADDKLEVKDAGLSVAKFRSDAISTAIPETGAADTKVPTELAVKTFTDGFGKSVDFSMDSTTYELTLSLKDASGNVLSTKTVDLPMETLVVDVEYDNDNQQFIITLKDGTKKYIPASGILRGVVTETATQTITNKTISADDNTIQNLEADNFKDVTTSDEDKTFIVGSDGKFALNHGKQYKRVSALPENGDVKFLYYLTTADATHPVGMYVWDGTSAYVALDKEVVVDNVTISTDSDGKLIVKDAGLTTAKFNSSAIATTIRSATEAEDTKLPTEKAVSTEFKKRIQFSSSTTSDAFTIGEDASGYYIEE